MTQAAYPPVVTSQEVSWRRSPALLLAVLGVSYIFNSMDRQAFPALLGPIRDDFGLTLSQGAFLSTVFAINIAIFGACGGWFMKRFGRRATLVGGMLSYSLFTCITPLASGYASLATYRALTGAGEALHICAMMCCVGAYFGSRRGAAIGVINACFGIGAFLGPLLATQMFAGSSSWSLPFYVFGGAGALVALLVWAAVPTEFSEARDNEGMTSVASGTLGPRTLFNSNLLACAVSFALVGFSFFAFTSLFATYLRTQLQYSVSEAGALFGLYGVGSLGGFVCGWLGDKLGKPGLLAVLAMLGVVGYLLFHLQANYFLQACLAISFGLLVSGYLYPRFFSVLQRNVPPHQVSHAVSIAMVSFYSPGLFAGYVFGRLTESYGWSTAATLVVAVPPAVACALTLLYRPHRARGA